MFLNVLNSNKSFNNIVQKKVFSQFIYDKLLIRSFLQSEKSFYIIENNSNFLILSKTESNKLFLSFTSEHLLIKFVPARSQTLNSLLKKSVPIKIIFRFTKSFYVVFLKFIFQIPLQNACFTSSFITQENNEFINLIITSIHYKF